MAILKTKNLRSGVSGNYWRILRVSVDVDTLMTTLDLALFLDETASSSGKSPIAKGKQYQFTFTPEEFVSGNLLDLGYTKILAKANSLIRNPFGEPTDPEIPFDPDLAGGESV